MADKANDYFEAKLNLAREQVEIGAQYFHYKTPDKHYTVKDIAILEASEEPCVIYASPYNNFSWVRPVANWLEVVPLNDGTQIARFQKVK